MTESRNCNPRAMATADGHADAGSAPQKSRAPPNCRAGDTAEPLSEPDAAQVAGRGHPGAGLPKARAGVHGMMSKPTAGAVATPGVRRGRALDGISRELSGVLRPLARHPRSRHGRPRKNTTSGLYLPSERRSLPLRP
jgi:hypothetical protein